MSRGRMLIWSLGTVVAAVVIALAAVRWTQPETSVSAEPSEASLHDWLHQNLGITAEQEAVLLPHELAYEAQRKAQRAKIREAGESLAAAIRASDHAEAPGIEAARIELAAAQAELQRLTLEHFYAMKAHLSPEQGEKLLRWTHDSILDGNSR